jgi:hypothetical protein
MGIRWSKVTDGIVLLPVVAVWWNHGLRQH